MVPGTTFWMIITGSADFPLVGISRIVCRREADSGRRVGGLFDRGRANRGGREDPREVEGAAFCNGFGAAVSFVRAAAEYRETQRGYTQWEQTYPGIGTSGIGRCGVYVGGHAGRRL